jgi:hypothetical protein
MPIAFMCVFNCPFSEPTFPDTFILAYQYYHGHKNTQRIERVGVPTLERNALGIFMPQSA